MKKILVLGATGQLGAYSALHLARSGRYDVVAVGRRASDNGFFADNGMTYIGGFTLENPDSYAALPTDINAVVHMAGTMPAHADASPMPYVRSIIEGMVNLCEWLRTSTNCRRVIFNTTPSDVCAYFGTDRPVPDDAPRSFPKDGGDHAVYAIAKSAAVDILEHYEHLCGISSIVFRHLTVYGWHPDATYYVNGEKRILPWRRIIAAAEAGETVEIWGNPSRKKELLYINDFTQAVEKAIESDITGIVNLSGDRPYTLEEQVLGIVKVFSPASHPSEVVYCPEKADTPQNLLDSNRARIALHWLPRFDWESGLRDMIAVRDARTFESLWGGYK